MEKKEEEEGGRGTIDREVNKSVTNSLPDLLDYSTDANFVNLVRLDEVEADNSVVFVVAGAG